MRPRAKLLENALPDLLSQPLQILAQLQRQAESLSCELAGLKQQLAHDAQQADTHVQLYGDETILIADDDHVVRSIAKEILEEFGYEVLLSDGKLLDVFDSVIDLVLLDVPLLDVEYLSRVKKARQHLAGSALIVCTPLPEGSARGQLRGLGVAGFVSKPYHPISLVYCIRQVLSR